MKHPCSNNHLVVEPSLNGACDQLWRLYFDVSSHKKGTGIGVVIVSPKNVPTMYKFLLNQFCLNNEDEYEALIAGLEILLELGAKRVEIKGDSEWLNCSFSPLTFPKLRFWPPKKTNYKTGP